MTVNITVVKTGFIGVTTLIEALLDERASRKDISVRSITSGSKMSVTDAQEVEKLSSSLDTDLYIVVSPNASLEAPKNLALNLGKIKPTILISDSPASKIKDELVDKIGYVFVQGDPLIGIHKEFLDPIEMSNFNSDVLKVLSITGAFRALINEIDKVIEQIKNSQSIVLPRLIIGKHTAVSSSGLTNPYSKAKALASYEIARLVAKLSAEGAYKEKNRERRLLTVSASHELIRQAAKLADEAHEIEKHSDSVNRYIHATTGKTLTKTKFFDSV